MNLPESLQTLLQGRSDHNSVLSSYCLGQGSCLQRGVFGSTSELTHTHTYTHTDIHTHTYTHMYIHIHTLLHTCTHTNTCTITHTPTHTHTDIHQHTPAAASLLPTNVTANFPPSSSFSSRPSHLVLPLPFLGREVYMFM